MTTAGMRGYPALIAAAIGSTDPALLALVEDFMRLEGGTLDALSAPRFAVIARQCLADVTAWREAGSVDGYDLAGYCAAMGLDYPRGWSAGAVRVGERA